MVGLILYNTGMRTGGEQVWPGVCTPDQRVYLMSGHDVSDVCDHMTCSVSVCVHYMLH